MASSNKNSQEISEQTRARLQAAGFSLGDDQSKPSAKTANTSNSSSIKQNPEISEQTQARLKSAGFQMDGESNNSEAIQSAAPQKINAEQNNSRNLQATESTKDRRKAAFESFANALPTGIAQGTHALGNFFSGGTLEKFIPEPTGFLPDHEKSGLDEITEEIGKAIPAAVGGAIALPSKLYAAAQGVAKPLLEAAKYGAEGAVYAGSQGIDPVETGVASALAPSVLKNAPGLIKEMAPQWLKDGAKKLFETAVGKNAPEVLIDAAGNPTPIMQKVLDTENKTLEDLIKGSKPVITTEVKSASQIENKGTSVDGYLNDYLAAKKAPAREIQQPKIEPMEQAEPQINAPSTSQKTEKELATDIAKNRFEELAGEVDVNPEIRGAARRLGIDVNPSVYSGNQTYREIEQGLASIPGSQLNKINVEAVEKLAKKSDEFIEEFGGKIDKAEFVHKFETESNKIIENLAKQSDDLYARLQETIPASHKVSTTNLHNYLNKQADDFGGTKYLPRLEKQILETLDEASGELTYAKVDHLRKQINQAAYGTGEAIFRDSDQASLGKLGYQLLEDQRRATKDFNMQGVFDAAGGLITQRKDIEKNLTEAIGRNLQKDIVPALGTALKDLSTKGSVKLFNKTLSGVPENMRKEAVLTAMNDVFTGNRNKEKMSIAGFSNWFNGLKRNKQAFDALQQYLPKEAVERLTDMGTLASGIEKASKSYISTGRAKLITDLFENLEGNVSKLFKGGMQATGSGALNVASGGATLPLTMMAITKKAINKKDPTKAADELLSSKKFRDTVEDIYVKGEPAAKKNAEILGKTKNYREWFATQDQQTKKDIASQGFLKWFMNRDDAKEKGDK